MPRKPVAAGALAGVLGAGLLFVIQLILQSNGSSGPPTGVAVATKLLHTDSSAALIVGILLFGLAGAIWGALYAAVVSRITPLTGLLFSLVPSLCALLVMLPILGKPAFAGGDPKGIITPLLLNSIWGLLVGALIPALDKRSVSTR